MRGKKPTPEFQKHLDLHYMPFLKAAIRAMHYYGFVPWRLMKLPSGDMIPEVLPPYSFRWSVERPNEDNIKMCPNNADALLTYVVRMVPGYRQELDVRITQWLPPHNVCENSILYATVPSPMSGIIETYKNLISAQKRQSHADAWNCTARIIVGNDPKEFAHDQHRREMFQTFHKHVDEFGRLQPLPVVNENHALEDLFYANSRNHFPAVYQLPNHHKIEKAPELKPVTELPMLHSKYKVDCCSLIGVPSDMVSNVNFHESKASNKTNSGGMATNRMFQAKMQNVCNFLRVLLNEVYSAIYANSPVEFDLTPMPRMEIGSIDDLKVLHEIGVLQPDHTVDLASILLGKLKKPKLNPMNTLGQITADDGSKKPNKESPEQLKNKKDKDQK